jgi:hypothetical protein
MNNKNLPAKVIAGMLFRTLMIKEILRCEKLILKQQRDFVNYMELQIPTQVTQD